MREVPQPVQTPILAEQGMVARSWVDFFQSLMARVRDLVTRVTELEAGGGGGGTGLPPGYEVITIPAGSGVYNLDLEPDFTQFEGMTYDLLVTRDIKLNSISPIGDFEGRRITLLLNSNTGYALTVDVSVSPRTNFPAMPVDSSVGIEGRLRQDGTLFFTSVYAY